MLINRRSMNSMSETPAVGVVGLGIMGGAFACNLLKDGFTVFGHDIDRHNVTTLVEQGGIACESAMKVASECDVLITALPSVSSFHEVISGEHGIASSNQHGLVVVECSTLSIEDKILAETRLAEKGIVLLDCPVSGTGAQAASKDLSIYVSGDQSAGTRCQEVLNAIASKTFYVGEFGNGSKMKFVANLLVHIHNVASAEAMVLAMKAGLDPETTYNVIKEGAGNSRIFELRSPMMIDNDYSNATMKMDIWQKDIQIIGDFINQLNCPTPLFEAGRDIYDKGMQQGMDKLDTASVCRVLEGMANIERAE